MTELTDGEKNLTLLVCWKDEIKGSEKAGFGEVNTAETLPCLSGPLLRVVEPFALL